MDMKPLMGLLLLLCHHSVSSVIHSMKYFETVSSGVSIFPEFVAVVMLDELQFMYYDSKIQTIEVKQWMDQLTRGEPDYMKRITRLLLGNQHESKFMIEILKKDFNQTGLHICQRTYGCEWDDEDNTTDGYEQFGYDGENFIELDLKTWTWISLTPLALPIKQKWNQDRAYLKYQERFYTKKCIDDLKKLLSYGKSTLQRTGRVT
ncbi:Major histocompatibility complex class I-related gene protein [Merluccius polli]|uniref:Major histocompatibility complex class I-related gene protein n=1 Tax=Merluccius polli TaxID=89951 RepID=A0AA47M9T3_MERPO|nr:Major histocompatibility complex class I-related gene protein [Merluccius polli]